MSVNYPDLKVGACEVESQNKLGWPDSAQNTGLRCTEVKDSPTDASLVRSSESDRSRHAKGAHETVCRKAHKG